MAYPLALPREVETALKNSPTKKLEALRNALLEAASHPDGGDEAIAVAAIVNYELQLREIEPVTRKITRGVNMAVEYCKANPEEVLEGVATAAVVALAVGLGVNIAKKS